MFSSTASAWGSPMDHHSPADPALFRRLQGRRVVSVEVDTLPVDGPDWMGIQFDGGEYLSIYARPTYGEPATLEVGFRRRCQEPYRHPGTGMALYRCKGFEGHGGSHV